MNFLRKMIKYEKGKKILKLSKSKRRKNNELVKSTRKNGTRKVKGKLKDD